MRKLIALAAVLAASALSLAAVPASASPGNAPAVHRSAITPDTQIAGQVQLCEDGTGFCMSGHGGADGPVTAELFAANAAETVDISAASECGGSVEYMPKHDPPVFCPFADHALDNKYSTDNLVTIQNHANHFTYSSPDMVDVQETNGGPGEVWVQDGKFLVSSGNPAATLINVQATAYETAKEEVVTPEAACALGTPGEQLVIETPGLLGGVCAWRIHS